MPEGFAKLISNETIVAVATAPSLGAIGIVRLSGSKARDILSRVWSVGGKFVDKLASTRLYYGNFINPSTGLIIDTGLAVSFQAPASYTGEDIVEFQMHGSPILLDQMVEVCVSLGAKIATPGEFTQRAFLNGKLDLAQAEAVADIIESSSVEGARRAQEQLNGRLSNNVRKILDQLTYVRAFVEATIDFPEDDVEFLEKERILAQVSDIVNDIQKMRATYNEGRLLREGARIALIGPPNAGKSSLLNAFLGEDRSIVHDSPGTTRDVIEETVVWDGAVLRFADTAGLREIEKIDAHATIETIGINRSYQTLSNADLIILVIDGSRELTNEELSLLSKVPSERTVIFSNKSDLPQQIDLTQLSNLFPKSKICSGSAQLQGNLDTLRVMVLSALRAGSATESDGVIITNRRHKDSLDRALNELNESINALRTNFSLEFLAEHFRLASDHLGSIVGDVTTEDLLAEIFRRFCIGK